MSERYRKPCTDTQLLNATPPHPSPTSPHFLTLIPSLHHPSPPSSLIHPIIALSSPHPLPHHHPLTPSFSHPHPLILTPSPPHLLILSLHHSLTPSSPHPIITPLSPHPLTPSSSPHPLILSSHPLTPHLVHSQANAQLLDSKLLLLPSVLLHQSHSTRTLAIAIIIFLELKHILRILGEGRVVAATTGSVTSNEPAARMNAGIPAFDCVCVLCMCYMYLCWCTRVCIYVFRIYVFLCCCNVCECAYVFVRICVWWEYARFVVYTCVRDAMQCEGAKEEGTVKTPGGTPSPPPTTHTHLYSHAKARQSGACTCVIFIKLIDRNTAHLKVSEVLDKVFEAHPKLAILLGIPLHLGFLVARQQLPLWRTVGKECVNWAWIPIESPTHHSSPHSTPFSPMGFVYESGEQMHPAPQPWEYRSDR